MLAAVRALPPLTTAGKASPTGPVPSGSFAASPAMVGIMASGVEGCGVGAEMSSPTRCPAATPTTPALMKDPPTSIPSNLRVMCRFPSKFGRLKVSRGGELHVALAPPVPLTHPHRCDHHPARHDRDHQGGERVHVRADAESHLGEDHHRQCARARPGNELRDDEVVPRESEGEQPS